MGEGPNILLCVGATKAGTTWLHDQLATHPECHLRTIKEYHYFSTNADAQWEKMIADTRSEMAQLSAMAPADVTDFDRQRLRDLASWLPMITPRKIDAAAFANYLVQGAQDERPSARLVGDFTPAYSVISGKLLEPAASLPRLKVLYLIRDPLARLWSHVRMIADRMDPDRFEVVAPAMLRRVIAGEEDGGIRSIVRRGDYAGNLPKLRRIFGKRLLVMFTEDLFTKAGFDRVLAFLGLSPALADLDRLVHEGRAMPLPADLRPAALKFLRPQYEFIAGEFAQLPSPWQANMAQFTPMPQTTKAVI
jgi:hypothetical protein